MKSKRVIHTCHPHRNTFRLGSAAALPVLLWVSVGAFAQTPPDAGLLQQQIERERKPSLPRKATPDKPAQPPTMPVQAGVIATVKKFHFAGNTLLSAEQLSPSVAAFLDRPLDYAQLQAAATAIANAYREAGWIVRAYLPRQEITGGIVTIQIIEAVFGGARLEGNEPQRLKLAQILDAAQNRQPVGAPVNAEALDRGLLIADDLPGVVVGGTLAAGRNDRETDLLLKVSDEALFTGEITLDNTGSSSTGEDRLLVGVNFNSLAGMGDLISVTALHTQGSDYLRLGGTLPVDSDGWRAGVTVSQLDYRLVGDDFASSKSSGSSSTAGLDLSYPIIRSKLRNLYFNANLDHKRYDNQSGGSTISHYSNDQISLGLMANLYDNLGGGGINNASLALVLGDIDLGDSPNRAAIANTTRTNGSYTKLRYSLSRQQLITDDFSIVTSLAGQWANKNLDSSEKFYLGGASGVRAYPSSEAGGASGQLANIELRWKLPEGFTVTGFYDTGHVRVNEDNDFPGGAAPNSYSLTGQGLSVAWQGGNGVNLKATLSRRVGDNPSPNPTTGRDQDGSLDKNRLWLSASLPF